MKKTFFTSESVTEGHPDKVCDRISDSILDAILTQDPTARVACETCCNTGFVLVMGEITTSAAVDITDIVRKTVTDIGYDNSAVGFDGNTCAVLTVIDKQSEDIAMGVNASAEAKAGSADAGDIGAGDQGMMFGYATRETDALMPMPIYLAHKLTRKLSEVRRTGVLKYLRPDGKSQVTVEYRDGKPLRVDAVVLSAQHDPDIDIVTLRKDLIEKVIGEAIPARLIDAGTKFYINPTGRFVIGGPMGDSGLTGRKIIADTYGGYCPHGGGAFSGKDSTKVDRSAAYMARYVCKNVVAAGLADECRLDISYAIGVAKPVSLEVNTFGSGKLSDEVIKNIIEQVFDMRPAAIINSLGLRSPVYADNCNYGHFGREGAPWERVDKAETLKKISGRYGCNLEA